MSRRDEEKEVVVGQEDIFSFHVPVMEVGEGFRAQIHI